MQLFTACFKWHVMSIPAKAIISTSCSTEGNNVGTDAPIHVNSYVALFSMPLGISFSETIIKLSAVTSVK